jgi:hypothetical protein
MTIIEVLLPDNKVRAYTTVEQSSAAIAEEAARLYPEASHWRVSKGWQGVAGGKRPSAVWATWGRAKPLAVVLALAIILTPVISWAATLNSGSAGVLHRFTGAAAAPAVEAETADAGPASVVRDVHIVGIAEQSSDTSRTVQVRLRNDGAQTHEDVHVRATFYDKFGTELPLEEGSVSAVTLAPQQEGFVKVWARSEYGVGQYELEIVEPGE